MALIHFRYYSAAIGMETAMYVALPSTASGPRPVIYQLHGLTDDHSAWQRRSTIELHAERIGAIVVMPEGGRYFYTDKADGTGRWETHILECVTLVDATFRTRANRNGRAIGGLSMGGYGALKLGLKHPQLFGSVAAHSGVADIRQWYRQHVAQDGDMRAIYGSRVKPSEDLFALALTAKPLPRLHFDCGTEDFLLEHNRRFHAHLDQRGIAHVYREYPGDHNWQYWEARLGEAFAFHHAWFSRGGGKR